MDRRTPVPLDQHVPYAMRRQQHRGRQPDKAAAHHQYGNFLVELPHSFL